MFKTHNFSYHKVSVVFWQTDENDEPANITEKYEKAFTAANIKKEQEFYDSELQFEIALSKGDEAARTIRFGLTSDDTFTKVYEKSVKKVFAEEVRAIEHAYDNARARNKAIKAFIKDLQAEVQFTHRHYIKDDEYIPYDENIEAFLEREIKKPIIRWEDAPQLGYEILPNKYFYQYQPPKPAEELLKDFWALEKEAEGILVQLEGAM